MAGTFPIPTGSEPKLPRQLFVEMLEEESSIEIAGEVTRESEIRHMKYQETIATQSVIEASEEAIFGIIRGGAATFTREVP